MKPQAFPFSLSRLGRMLALSLWTMGLWLGGLSSAAGGQL
jgi:hypothetical protein